MNPQQQQLLVIHLVRDPETIRAAQDRLTDEIFDPTSELVDLALWSVSRGNFSATGGATPREHMLPSLMRKLNEELPYHGMSDEQIASIVHTIYSFPSESLDYRLIRPLLEEFILSRRAQPKLQQLAAGGGSHREIIEDLWSAVRATSLSSVEPEDLGQIGIDVFRSAQRTPTGCQPIDVLLGGIRRGETIGLLGPVKGGKTSLAISLACDWIKRSGRVSYISYEEPTFKQWPKALVSFMNKYRHDRLEGLDPAQMTPELRADLQRAFQVLAPGLFLFDMSGTRPGQGAGGIGELELCLEDMHRRGKLGEIVIVDHVYKMVTHYMAAANSDPSHMRHVVQEVCDRFVSLMGRLNVTGVLLHQMDAAGNKSPLRKPSHMDAAECKLFPQFLHAVLCLGVKDPSNGVAWLNLSAARSLEPKAIHVKIAGERCRVELTGAYHEDERTGRFVTDDERAQGLTVGDADGDGRPPAAIGFRC